MTAQEKMDLPKIASRPRSYQGLPTGLLAHARTSRDTLLAWAWEGSPLSQWERGVPRATRHVFLGKLGPQEARVGEVALQLLVRKLAL